MPRKYTPMRQVLEVEITLENAAFDDAPMSEAARILRKLADQLEAGGGPIGCHAAMLADINGNLCGVSRIRKRRGIA